MGLDIRNSTSVQYEYLQDSAVAHVMPTILRTYEKLCHALFPEVKSTHRDREQTRDGCKPVAVRDL